MLPSEKGRERHRKFLGAQTWHLKAVIETLPTLLQLSLFFFSIAQIDFFWPINTTIAITLATFVAITFSFYIGTTLIAIFASGSPFQTRLSALLYRVKVRFMPNRDEDENDVIGAGCVYWLMQTATLPDALTESIRALSTLSGEARDALQLNVSKVLQSLLRPSIVDSKIQWGISTESPRSSLSELLQLLNSFDETSWNNLLPPATPLQVKRSLRVILMKVVLSFSTDGEVAQSVSTILCLPSLKEEQDSTELDPLHSVLIRHIPTPPSHNDLYTNIAIICLHIKQSSPASEVAIALGISFQSLKEHITSLSLDVLFAIPTSPSERILLHHPSFLPFIEDRRRCSNAGIQEAMKEAHERFEAHRLASLLPGSNRNIPDSSPAGQNQSSDLPPNSLVSPHLTMHPHESPLNSGPDESTLLQTSNLLQSHFFHWLEELALRKQLDTAIPFLKQTHDWLTAMAPSSPLIQICNEGQEMINRFYYEIEQHPTSMNLSVLPFLPPSTLRQTYLEISSSSAPVAKSLLGNPLAWSSFPHEILAPSNENGVLSVAFSINGKHILCSSETTIRICDRSRPAITRALTGHTDSIASIALFSNGKSVVSGSYDKTVRIWDFDSGICIHTLEGHTDLVDCVAVYRDGICIASGARDNTVRVWDAANGECQRILTGHMDHVGSVVFSPDGEKLVSGSSDHSIRVWNVTSGETVRTLNGHTDWVLSTTFTPDGQLVSCSGSNDMTVRIWDITTGDCNHILRGHTDGIHSVGVSTNNKLLASSSKDGSVRVWEVSTDSLLNLYQASTLQWTTAISPDCNQIVSGGSGGKVSLWDSTSSHRLTPLNLVEFSSDGLTLKAALSDGTHQEWPLASKLTTTPDAYSYTISSYPADLFENDSTHAGELFEERDGEKRLACRVPASIYWNGCKLISSGRHVVLWHKAGLLLHIDFSSTPP